MPTLFYDIWGLRSKYIRYLVLTMLVFMSGLLYSILSYHVIIMLILPVAVSCLYCERACVIYTTVLNIPVMVLSHLIAFMLKIVPDEPLVTLQGVLVYGIIPRVIELAETQSHETGQHVKRVAAFTEILCRAMGLSEEETWKVSVASMMHDVGKICVPREILHKSGKLTEEEFSEIKKHVDYGYKLLKNSPGEIMQLAASIAQQHHERFDGKGYQNKLEGEHINIYARCVAVADVFDALVSKRCYKKSWTPEQAREEILGQAGRQFDPQITKLFDEHFDEFLKVLENHPDASVNGQ